MAFRVPGWKYAQSGKPPSNQGAIMANALVRFITGDDNNDKKKSSDMELVAAEYREELRFGAFATEGDAHLTKYCMDKAVEVDAYRRQLAGDDETLNALLVPLEMAFINRTATRVNGGKSPNESKWGF